MIVVRLLVGVKLLDRFLLEPVEELYSDALDRFVRGHCVRHLEGR